MKTMIFATVLSLAPMTFAAYPIIQETGTIKISAEVAGKVAAPADAKFEKLVTSVTCVTKCRETGAGQVCNKDFRHDQESWDYILNKKADGFRVWTTNFSPVVCDSGVAADATAVILQDDIARGPLMEALGLNDEQ